MLIEFNKKQQKERADDEMHIYASLIIGTYFSIDAVLMSLYATVAKMIIVGVLDQLFGLQPGLLLEPRLPLQPPALPLE